MKLDRVAAGVLAATVLALDLAAASPSTAATACPGTQVRPGVNLVELVHGSRDETFCLAAGTYDIGARTLEPGSGSAIVGAPVTVTGSGALSAPTKIVGHSRDGIIDLGKTRGVVLENLDVSGATGFKDDADDSTKQDGRGIQQGFDVTIRYVVSHDNASTGIGALQGGAAIDHVELYNNGSASYLGCCSGGIKAAAFFAISNSYVHDNIGNGIWVDHDAGFRVIDNVVRGNSRSGIRYEHGDVAMTRAAIIGNVVRGNDTSGKHADTAGIVVNSAPNAEIAYNRLGDNGGEGVAVRGNRGPVAGTKVHDNRLAADVVKGCALARVSCFHNS